MKNAHPRGVTIIEIIVVIGILSILAVITTLAIAGVRQGARLSMGQNAVEAALGEARARAMQDNKATALVFRARFDGTNPSATEMVLCQRVDSAISNGYLVDRLLTLDQEPRVLPDDIKVAGPWYDTNEDDTWITQPTFPIGNEAAGRQFAVIFAPDGSCVSHFPESVDADAIYVDFDRDGSQDIGSTTGNARYFLYDEADDENSLQVAVFLAVFDDREAREWTDDSDWDDPDRMRSDYTAYINSRADRIHFNRYTGVIMK